MSSKSGKSRIAAPVQPKAPVSDCEVRDPRVRRTRQLLQSALETLLKTRSFDEIGVQDVTDEATVNRATFYDHYTDKFALLEAWVASGFHRLLSERNVRFDGTCASGAAALILATCDYLRESRGDAETCRRQNPFEPLMDAAVITAIRRVLIPGMSRSGRSRQATTEMAASAAAWAILGAAKEWLRMPNRPPAEKCVPAVLRFVLPILESDAKAPLPVKGA